MVGPLGGASPSLGSHPRNLPLISHVCFAFCLTSYFTHVTPLFVPWVCCGFLLFPTGALPFQNPQIPSTCYWTSLLFFMTLFTCHTLGSSVAPSHPLSINPWVSHTTSLLVTLPGRCSCFHAHSWSWLWLLQHFSLITCVRGSMHVPRFGHHLTRISLLLVPIFLGWSDSLPVIIIPCGPRLLAHPASTSAHHIR